MGLIERQRGLFPNSPHRHLTLTYTMTAFQNVRPVPTEFDPFKPKFKIIVELR